MGVFFRSKPLEPIVRDRLSAAFAADPTAGALPQLAAAQAKEVAREAQGDLDWSRLAFAAALLVLLFVAAVYTGRDTELAELNSKVTSGFELILGVISGLLIGEAASRG